MVIAADRVIYRLSRKWMLIFSLLFGLFVGAPFMAPIFMQLGWIGVGKTTYSIYSFLCHQFPQRSYFLFGDKAMFSLGEIQSVWQNTINPLVLRQFIGNAEMGWKVAWSDRMVSMYTSILFFAWIWYPLRKKLKTMPWWIFLLLLVPMGIDGITHMISDIFGIGQGFRDSNAWLATLTNNSYPATFYAGDALGSFNSWMRLITGVIFGLGIVWFGFPYVDEAFSSTAKIIKDKFNRAELEL
jgi:uncharacterized membrane protein